MNVLKINDNNFGDVHDRQQKCDVILRPSIRNDFWSTLLFTNINAQRDGLFLVKQTPHI
jgi:hypothetical protein